MSKNHAFDGLVFVYHLQLRLAVVESIGYCVHLLAADSLNEQLPKLVSGVVQLYRKHSEHYYITQVLLYVIPMRLCYIHVHVCLYHLVPLYDYGCSWEEGMH